MSKSVKQNHPPIMVQRNRMAKENSKPPSCGYHGKKTAHKAAARRTKQEMKRRGIIL